jgi:methionyl-tRNA formyltransferase
LARQGAALLIKTIDQVISGTARRRAQDPSGVTYAPRLTKETGKIEWHENIVNITNLIRGLSPSPAAYTWIDRQMLKVYAAEPLPGRVDESPGTICAATPAGLAVAAADGCVLLKDIQLAGKKRMLIGEFLRGHRMKAGNVLG